MFNKILKIGVALAALTSFGSAQALPISGQVGFTGYGDFFTNGSGDLIGYDFDLPGGANDPSLVLQNPAFGLGQFWTGGQIGLMAGNPTTANEFTPAPLTLELFDFAPPLPAIEWVLGTVTTLGTGVQGNIIFEVLTAIDTSPAIPDPNAPNQKDMAGTGRFTFDCTDTMANCGLLDSAIDAIDLTLGTWSISQNNSGTGIFDLSSGLNVPAPATIGLLGLGLLGLGAVRRRRGA